MQIVQAQIKPITDISANDALLAIQRVAKTCYKSYSDSDDIESAKRLTKALLASGHTAMFEFYNITMNYVSNIAAYKDLTRHRHASYAIESTRWCNYSKDKHNGEIKFLDPIEISKDTKKYDLWMKAMQQAEQNYLEMAAEGALPDELSLVLPQSTAAEFNISANLREWRHILSLRSSIFLGKPLTCPNFLFKYISNNVTVVILCCPSIIALRVPPFSDRTISPI